MGPIEGPQERCARVLDSLFKSSPTLAPRSSPDSSTQVNMFARNGFQEQAHVLTRVVPPPSGSAGLAMSTTNTVGTALLKPLCRPWHRGDLLRRLSTFKSITWFGKPQLVDPVACSIRGWVNVDVDLLACEICNARLSFVIPPSWSRTQVHSAAVTFSEQLESGHKTLCAWKGNMCSEALLLFPPTPVPVLVQGFNDRCERLLKISALPVISTNAVEALKRLRGPQIEALLSRPPSSALREGNEQGESGYSHGFYLDQRLIALCGWEPRFLQYAVDYEKSSAPSVKDTKLDGASLRKSRDSGLNVLFLSKLENLEEKSEETKSDPASVILDCSLCGASVGLWGFSTLPRWAGVLNSVITSLPDPLRSSTDTLMCGVSATSGVDGGNRQGFRTKDAPESHEEAGDDASTNPVNLRSSTLGVLSLGLTIAGGPPPTQMSAALISSAFAPISGIQVRSVHAEANEVGNSVGPLESIGTRLVDSAQLDDSATDILAGRQATTDSVDGTVRGHDVDESKASDGTEYLKRTPKAQVSALHEFSQEPVVTFGNAVFTREVDQGPHRKKLKSAKDGAVACGSFSHYGGHGLKDSSHSSSVNAIDTHWLHKHEPYVESADNLLRNVDGHGEVASADSKELIDEVKGTERVTEAPESEKIKKVGTGENGYPPELGFGKGHDFECDVHLGTNLNTIQTVLGGGIGMGESQEAEIQGEASGADVSTLRTDGADGTENQAIIVDLVPHQALPDNLIAENEEKPSSHNVCEQSDKALGILPGRHSEELGSQTGAFDPIRQHRHFCPWVNEHVPAKAKDNRPVVSGWQLTVDALYAQESSESVMSVTKIAGFWTTRS